MNQTNIIRLVIQHEKDRLMRVATSLCNSINIVDPNDNHMKTWVDENQHGFIITHQQQTCDYNEELTHSWLKRRGTISHTEGFICAIQEQETRTRALIAKREQGENPTYDKKCRYCHNHTEDIFHLLSYVAIFQQAFTYQCVTMK